MTIPNDELLARLTKIETLLASLVEQRAVKEWYSTAEVATLLGKAEFDAPVRSTPVVADGVMYVMTEKTLYALEPKK